MRLTCSILILLAACSSQATLWYVDNSAVGVRNGTNWANAWTNVSNVSGTAVGDTVYISGGSSGSSNNYTGPNPWTITSSGVTYTPGIDAGHNGTVVLQNNPVLLGTNIVLANMRSSPLHTGAGVFAADIFGLIFEGTNCIITNIDFTGFTATYLQQATMCVFHGVGNLEINCHYHDVPDIDVHHIWGYNNTINGCTYTNITQPNYGQPSGNHVDLYQTYNADSSNILIINDFATLCDCQVGNTEMDSAGLKYKWTFENCIYSSVSNSIFSGIPNTTFYNCVFDNVGTNQGAAITFYSESDSGNQRVSTNCAVLNTVLIHGQTIGYFNQNNNSSYPSVGPSNIPQVGNYTGNAPKFTDQPNANYHLNTGSPLIGTGTNLYSIFTTDAAGNTRPSSGAWDVGAFVFQTAATGAPFWLSQR